MFMKKHVIASRVKKAQKAIGKNKKKGLCEKWMLRIGERGGKAAVH